jgi:RNA polymerase sigma-70 factor (ECF subfamily)
LPVAENLSMGLVLMLERLSPAERAVFVLREGFDLPFDDIGSLVGASATSCRQRYRRARVRLGGEAQLDGIAAAAREGELEFRWLLDGVLHSTVQAEVTDDRIRALYIVRNPHKLAHLAAALE